MADPIKVFDDLKIIGVIRTSDHGDAETVAKSLIDGGVRIIEITSHVPQAAKLIESLSKQPDLYVGFGSATDGETAFRAINAGAKFISSHYTDKNIIAICKNHDITLIQGAATINEVMQAFELGVDLIKIYPASFLGGVPYIRRIRRSFPFLKLVPSGDVNLETFPEYLRAGAVACEIGNAICDRSHIRLHQWNEITNAAKAFVQKVETLKVARSS
ncbi:MAG: hypothetical protein A3G33_09950 [Omnitrophica bacterium RIFCSPLOWO2_12_FULL_44_17]|uniref:2-dehydro-3-deoxyphosphogluconate aldolase n=1 Tax=Candidatus Danuiimicrobium aquiferis TaxID=1801832 RepID=A0A1G1L1X2_9BACT|nr:MAG: hypothetical protein A3B72_08660 [Omnitrophica bacterium RIFCSPHIGHO2_02_FULL_45_28]OGW88260.1 MAG: hypothetical protein A3E74_02750 [Omnitrophica bacterium RIFCSPHIGHO2_12_FULL_44_12]OGW99145.1 MAG: hypothetical protein A3G33_09950 [Omnitrophica bacterium RIFCSPLOWO2_12_FULL_44_17]OGX03174.1 MAG: hypothetical protein A3J12_09750 [Omnitrophica bacterium RIFCSPLOWO2_02_FULL_44_11]